MRSLRNYIERMKRTTVVVHMGEDGGASLRGVLVGVYRDVIVLEHAEALGEDGAVKIDGRAAIPHERVAWIQDPGEGSAS